MVVGSRMREELTEPERSCRASTSQIRARGTIVKVVPRVNRAHDGLPPARAGYSSSRSDVWLH